MRIEMKTGGYIVLGALLLMSAKSAAPGPVDERPAWIAKTSGCHTTAFGRVLVARAGAPSMDDPTRQQGRALNRARREMYTAVKGYAQVLTRSLACKPGPIGPSDDCDDAFLAGEDQVPNTASLLGHAQLVDTWREPADGSLQVIMVLGLGQVEDWLAGNASADPGQVFAWVERKPAAAGPPAWTGSSPGAHRTGWGRALIGVATVPGKDDPGDGRKRAIAQARRVLQETIQRYLETLARAGAGHPTGPITADRLLGGRPLPELTRAAIQVDTWEDPENARMHALAALGIAELKAMLLRMCTEAPIDGFIEAQAERAFQRMESGGAGAQ